MGLAHSTTSPAKAWAITFIYLSLVELHLRVCELWMKESLITWYDTTEFENIKYAGEKASLVVLESTTKWTLSICMSLNHSIVLNRHKASPIGTEHKGEKYSWFWLEQKFHHCCTRTYTNSYTITLNKHKASPTRT